MAVTKIRPYIQDVGTSYAALYTVGGGLTTAMNMIRAINKSASTVTVDVELWPLGVEANAVAIEHAVTLAPGQPWNYKGYRALLATDEIRVKASATSAVDFIGSGLEHDASPAYIHQGLQQSVSASPTYDTLFTGPTNDAAVNDLALFNKSASVVTVDLELWPLGVSGNKIILMQDHPIKAGKRYDHIGVIPTLNTDLLKISASAGSAIDALLSAVER